MITARAKLALAAAAFAVATFVGCSSTPQHVPAETSVVYNAENGRPGCWVEIYEREDFQGRSARLAGPLELASLNLADLGDWTERINSIRVGPMAEVELFGDLKFEDRRQIYPAGREIASLEKDADFGGEAASMRITHK